ncbi:MAG: hypothetical protein AB3N64_08890 [Puniceicoccaceae bacterium]
MKLLHISLFLLMVPCLWAQDSTINTLLKDLGSPDYEKRQSARNELHSRALGVAGSGDTAALMDLESELVAAVASTSIGREEKLYVSRLLAESASARIAGRVYDATMAASGDPVLRDHLIQTLSSLPGEEVTRLILKGLATADATESTTWWQAIARQGSPAIAPELISLLENGQASLGPESVAALGRLGGPTVAGFLYSQWANASDDTRADLELALIDSESCDIGQLQSLLSGSEYLTTKLAAFYQILQHSEATALEILEERLGNEQPSDDSAMLSLALSTGSKQLRDFIVDNRQLLDAREQAVLIGAIAGQEWMELESVVLDIAQSGDPAIQAVAVRALSVLASSASVPYLSELLLSDDDELQGLAAHALSTVVDPSLDEKILQMVQDIGNPARGEYLSLMAIRNNEGAVDVVNILLKEELATPATGDILSVIEAIGDLESCRILIHAILRDSPDLPTRKLQLCLKRLSLRLAIEDYLWEHLYLPSLINAPNDDSRARIIEILDCLSRSREAMKYVTGILEENANTVLVRAANGSSRRWTSMNIGSYWLGVAMDRNASSREIRTAMAALKRLITSDSVEGRGRDKAAFAFNAVTKLRDEALRKEILDAVLDEKSIRGPFLNNLKTYRFIIEHVDSREAAEQAL